MLKTDFLEKSQILVKKNAFLVIFYELKRLGPIVLCIVL
jgi:hypothetical protein